MRFLYHWWAKLGWRFVSVARRILRSAMLCNKRPCSERLLRGMKDPFDFPLRELLCAHLLVMLHYRSAKFLHASLILQQKAPKCVKFYFRALRIQTVGCEVGERVHISCTAVDTFRQSSDLPMCSWNSLERSSNGRPRLNLGGITRPWSTNNLCMRSV